MVLGVGPHLFHMAWCYYSFTHHGVIGRCRKQRSIFFGDIIREDWCSESVLWLAEEQFRVAGCDWAPKNPAVQACRVRWIYVIHSGFEEKLPPRPTRRRFCCIPLHPPSIYRSRSFSDRLPQRVVFQTGGTTLNSDTSQYVKQIAGEIWTSDQPYRNLEYFCDVIGSRWAGSDSEHTGGEYLKSKLEEYGLKNVRLEPVEFGAWTRGHATLKTTSPVQKEFSCIALPYCPAGDIEVELINAGNGEAEDIDALGDAVKGKVVIVAAETGTKGVKTTKLAHRTDKLRFAEDAGALGAIFVNQNPGLLHITGGIAAPGGKPAAIFGVGTSWEHGQAIKRLIDRSDDPVVVSLSVGGSFAENTSFNVVGEIPGATRPDELVIAGAHYDGHDISQAALDDGAGTMVTLEAARVLATLPPEAIGRTIRFILFCGEEVGLFGSWGYTADHEDDVTRTTFMMNLDGAGQGRGGKESMTISGRPELVPYFEEYADEALYEFNIKDLLGPHSDHYPFAIRGIPTVSLNSPDDSSAGVGRGWGHTEADTFDKANLRGLQMSAMLAARILQHVASDDEFPADLKSGDELREQLTDLGLDTPLKRAGRWDLVGKTS